MAALDFLTSLLVELDEMLRVQRSQVPFPDIFIPSTSLRISYSWHIQALVVFVQSIIQRSKLQKCLLHLLLTAVHDPRRADANRLVEFVRKVKVSRFGPQKAEGVCGLSVGFSYSRPMYELTDSLTIARLKLGKSSFSLGEILTSFQLETGMVFIVGDWLAVYIMRVTSSYTF